MKLRDLKVQAQQSMSQAQQTMSKADNAMDRLVPLVEEGLGLFKKFIVTATTVAEDFLDGFEASVKWGSKVLPLSIFIDPGKESKDE